MTRFHSLRYSFFENPKKGLGIEFDSKRQIFITIASLANCAVYVNVGAYSLWKISLKFLGKILEIF